MLRILHFSAGGVCHFRTELICLPMAAWHRSPSYNLRRTRRDLPDLAATRLMKK
jgi:hypothetical protein